MEQTQSIARRRFRMNIRAWLGIVGVFGVGFGWYLHTVRTQQSVIAAIREVGGSVTYDWEWGGYDPNISSVMDKPRAPRWLSMMIGPDYVASVERVGLVPTRGNANKADDRTLEAVGRLGHLKSLWLNGTDVTDAGLVHLRGLINLRTLYVDGSGVTDNGVLALEEALPKIQIFRGDDAVDVARNTRAMNDLAFASTLPVRVAAPTLLRRAKAMSSRADLTEFSTTLHALCSLDSENVFDLMKLAEARGECLGLLEPTVSPRLPAAERQRLWTLSESRGIDALTNAVDRGFNNVRRLDGDGMETRAVGNLCNHPSYPKLIETLRARRAKP